MSPLDDLEQAIRSERHMTSPALDRQVLNDAAAALAVSSADPERSAGFWRTAMRNNLVKLATAAVLVLIPAGLWIAFHGAASQAYAIEQTLEASRSLRSIHLRVAGGESVEEFWAELNMDGTLRRLRMNFSRTEDGPKEVVWAGDKADIWFKAKNGYTTVREPDILSRLTEIYRILDPSTITSELYQQQASGKATIEIAQPPQPDGDIVITVTTPSGDRRRVYHVDAGTKLVDYVENYRRESGQYVLQTTWEYLEYNQPLAEEIFVLNPPADVIRVDQTTQVVGMAKGELTDAEITIKVATDFFEALIARDYAKAGRLLGGLPAGEVEKVLVKLFGQLKYIRIVSIGEPEPAPEGVGGMHVKFVVEVEADGVRREQTFEPAVRPVYNQPERWNLHGL